MRVCIACTLAFCVSAMAPAQEEADNFMVAVLAGGGTASLVSVTFEDLKELAMYDADVSLGVTNCRIDSVWFLRVALFVIDAASLQRIPDSCRVRLRYPARAPVFIYSKVAQSLTITSATLEEVLPYQIRGATDHITLFIRHRAQWYDGIDVRVVYVE